MRIIAKIMNNCRNGDTKSQPMEDKEVAKELQNGNKSNTRTNTSYQ